MAYKTAIYNHFIRLVEKGENASAKKLKDLFNGVDKERKTLIQIFKCHNDNLEKRVGKDYAKGTYERFKTCLWLLKEFMEQTYRCDDILLENIKLAFVADFDFYLKNKKKL